jgi:hypothetical protein
MPGMLSFNLWTDCPTPTRKNTTVWFALLTESEQLEIITALERSPRACIIVEEDFIELLRAISMAPRGVLYDYVVRNFAPAFQIETFTFLVRKDRSIIPFQLIVPSAGGLVSRDLTFCVAGERVTIAAIEAAKIGILPQPGRLLDTRDTIVTMTPIDSKGRPTGPTQPTQWPLQINGLARVQLTLPPGQSMRDFDVFYLQNPKGDRFAEIRR